MYVRQSLSICTTYYMYYILYLTEFTATMRRWCTYPVFVVNDGNTRPCDAAG